MYTSLLASIFRRRWITTDCLPENAISRSTAHITCFCATRYDKSITAVGFSSLLAIYATQSYHQTRTKINQIQTTNSIKPKINWCSVFTLFALLCYKKCSFIKIHWKRLSPKDHLQRNYFNWHRKRTLNDTHFIFNTRNLNSMRQLYHNQRTFMQVKIDKPNL